MARTTACSSWEAAVIAAVVLTGFSKPAAAGQASAPQLAVGIQDEADVPARILTAAQAQVARVFRRAGVETIWVATTTADLTIVIRSGKRVERTRFGTRYDRAGDGGRSHPKRPSCVRFLQPHRIAQVDDTHAR